MEYYGSNDWRDYLAHYGVKGMKWKKHLKAKEEIRSLGLRGRTAQMVKTNSKIGIIKGVAGAAARTPGVLNTSDDGFIYVSDKSKRVGDGPYMNAAEKAAAIKAQNKEIKAAKKAAKKAAAKREAKKALDKKGKEKASGAGESVYRNRKAISRALDKAGASGKTKSSVEKRVPTKIKQEIESSKNKKGSVASTARSASSKASSRVAKSVSNVISNAKQKISNAQSGRTRTNRQRLGLRQRV